LDGLAKVFPYVLDRLQMEVTGVVLGVSGLGRVAEELKKAQERQAK
jgi:hypothetical protein